MSSPVEAGLPKDPVGTALADAIRSGVREVARLLKEPPSEQADTDLENATSDLLIAVGDGFALLVQRA